MWQCEHSISRGRLEHRWRELALSWSLFLFQRDIGSPLVNWLGRLAGVALQQRKTCGVQGLPTSYTNLADPAVNQWITDNIK